MADPREFVFEKPKNRMKEIESFFLSLPFPSNPTRSFHEFRRKFVAFLSVTCCSSNTALPRVFDSCAARDLLDAVTDGENQLHDASTSPLDSDDADHGLGASIKRTVSPNGVGSTCSVSRVFPSANNISVHFPWHGDAGSTTPKTGGGPSRCGASYPEERRI